MVSKITHGERKDHYIAMSRDLQEILEAPVRSEMREIQYRLDIAIKQMNKQQGRIDSLLELPWFKRAWRAMRGDV